MNFNEISDVRANSPPINMGYYCRYAHNEGELARIKAAAPHPMTNSELRPLEAPNVPAPNAFAKPQPYSPYNKQ